MRLFCNSASSFFKFLRADLAGPIGFYVITNFLRRRFNRARAVPSARFSLSIKTDFLVFDLEDGSLAISISWARPYILRFYASAMCWFAYF